MSNLSRPIARASRRSLILIFVAAALLLAASLAIVFGVGHLSLEAQAKTGRELLILNAIHTLGSTLKDAETGQRGYLLTDKATYLEPFTNALTQISSQITVVQQFAESGEVSKGDVDRLRALIQNKLSELNETIRLRRESGTAAALSLVMTDRGKNTMDEIRHILDGLESAARADHDNALLRTAALEKVRTVAFIAATFVNLIFLAWAFRRIAIQEWLQSGQSQLAERLAGDKNLSELGGNALGFLAEYLGAQIGSIYLEEDGAFQRFGTYAISNPEGVPARVKTGEGLLGQAARDQRPFVVNEVPADYLSVSSSLGRGAPRRLIVAPTRVDGSVNGIIELGFFHAGDKSDLDLLERVSELVGVAVRSAKYRTRLQDLLEETQRQAEELQTQSEELRVSNEELEEQSRAIKESQARLEQQHIELEQSNSQLEEQTQILETQKDDLGRAKSELERQAALVEKASRYKSDFLANMSHELRTPLNSSLILAKLLADNRPGNLTPEQIKYAQTIQSSGNDLLALINDVLDLAKVEAGHMELRPDVFPISDLVDSMRGLFDPLAKNKGLQLSFQISAGAPEMFETDRRRLEQVLKNLLSNAIKFTEHGEVALNVNARPGGKIAFAVSDTGIGIAEDQWRLVFEPFCQVDSTASRKYGGTGLGLSISRELARLLGGDIQLHSEMGKGSTFTVVLPLAFQPAVVTARAPRPELPTPLPKATASPEPTKAVARRPAMPDDREHLRGDTRLMLIVEDDISFATILLDLGHEMGFQCLVADTAEESLALAAQFLPTAIILDIGLPDNSGMFVLQRLKVDARTRHIPVHVVSGNDYSQTALAMGAVGYILKPVKREALIEAFQRLETRLTQKLHRVLVVEDDPVQLDSLRDLLGSREVEAVGVRTAAECLEKLKATTFDCMVLDLSLPDTSGFALLETLSAEQTYSFPPVIVYTGRELTLEEEQCLRKYSKSIIIKGARSPERLLDEVTLFLHQVVSDLPPEKQKMLEVARNREAALEDRGILIAEDDVRNIFALTSLLEPKGVRLQIARNGREALEALQKSADQIDLVLMDIMMPEMNGLTAMREIRKNPDWKRLPIIALTAKAMKTDQEQCIEAGANDYLSKPLDVEKLLSLIRVWMPR